MAEKTPEKFVPPGRTFEVVHGDVGCWTGPRYAAPKDVNNGSPTLLSVGDVFTEEVFRRIHPDPSQGTDTAAAERYYEGVFKRLMEPTLNGVPARIRFTTTREPTPLPENAPETKAMEPYVDPFVAQMLKMSAAVARATITEMASAATAEQRTARK
jgi:hypothetical protein